VGTSVTAEVCRAWAFLGAVELAHRIPQIICSSRSACMERPSCYPSQHWADNGHFLQTPQNCFVYWFV